MLFKKLPPRPLHTAPDNFKSATLFWRLILLNTLIGINWPQKTELFEVSLNNYDILIWLLFHWILKVWCGPGPNCQLDYDTLSMRECLLQWLLWMPSLQLWSFHGSCMPHQDIPNNVWKEGFNIRMWANEGWKNAYAMIIAQNTLSYHLSWPRRTHRLRKFPISNE